MRPGPGQFTVVKFVPDSVRFEPINVGVVLETPDEVITRMAGAVDPRIRFADPYADLRSLAEFLASFDAEALRRGSDSVVDALVEGTVSYPNLYFEAPRTADPTKIGIRTLADALFDRLVRRSFVAPPGFRRPASPTAARTALRRAFESAKVLGNQVRPAVVVRGRSGVDWDLDFEYLTSEVHRVQTATTGLRGDLRRSEHAFKAFAALVDTTSDPGTAGILATDEPAAGSDLSGELAKLAEAHGIRYLGGQRAFLELARQVKDSAQPISLPATAGSQSNVSGQLLLL